MEFLNVIVAAAGSFILGAIWYTALAEPWMKASGVPRDADGKPAGGQSPGIFAAAFAMQLIVAGMMRHIFELAAIDTIGKGIVAGLGIGLFFITPWMVINNLYGMRPAMLTIINGGYAVLGCSVIGLILVLF